MPSYERLKYCGQLVGGWPPKKCGRIAYAECSGIHHPGIPHREDVRGWATPPEETVNHPRFVCPEHEGDE